MFGDGAPKRESLQVAVGSLQWHPESTIGSRVSDDFSKEAQIPPKDFDAKTALPGRSTIQFTRAFGFGVLPIWLEKQEELNALSNSKNVDPATAHLMGQTASTISHPERPYSFYTSPNPNSIEPTMVPKWMSGQAILQILRGGLRRGEIYRLLQENKPSTVFMNPREKRRVAWDIMGIFILSFDLIFISLQAFEPDETGFTRVCSYITLGYWTFDVAASLTTGYYTKDGRLVMAFRYILWRYLKTWFLFDCIVLGVDWLMLIAKWYGNGGSSAGESFGIARLGKVARMARIARSVRLLRLLKVRQLMQAVQESIDSEMISIIMGMLKNTIVLLLINHSIAALWFLVGRISTPKPTWTMVYELDSAPFTERYIVSLHWSLTQFTPGSMHVQPQNTLERTFSVIVLVFGMLVFSSFVSSITSSMARLRNLKAWEHTQSFLLRKFLKENQISRDLSARVSRYIDLVLERHQRRTDPKKVEFLLLLSGPLHLELQRELIEPHLIMHPWFEHYGKACSGAMNQLCFNGTTQTVWAKGDILFRSYTETVSMCIVSSGTMFYKRIAGARSRKVLKRLVMIDKGRWFCEAVLWVPWCTRGTMRSLIESELIAIDKKRFEDVTVSHPSATKEACSYAIHFVERLTKTVENYGQAFDLEIEMLMKDPSTKDLIPDEGDDREEQEVQRAAVVEAALMNESDSESEEEDCRVTDIFGEPISPTSPASKRDVGAGESEVHAVSPRQSQIG